MQKIINCIARKEFVIYAKENFSTDDKKKAFKKYNKVRDHFHYTSKYRHLIKKICKQKFWWDINKFLLLLKKWVYPYEYMDSWKRFNEISLPDNEDFYSHLNMKKKHTHNCWLSAL